MTGRHYFFRTALSTLALLCAANAIGRAGAGAAVGVEPVTYSSDVAPLVATHCAACHHPGGPAPFSLLSYEDVAPRAQDIARAVESGLMPRWKPEPDVGGPFVGERRLSEGEVATLRQWADAGAPAGDPVHSSHGDLHQPDWRLGTPDLVVSLPQAFTLPAGGRDLFRNFALPLPVETAKLVKGIEFVPDNHVVTHHANIRVDPTGSSSRFDARDPAPGYAGIASPTAVFPDGYFLGWTPGQAATFQPPGLAWRLAPSSTLAVELHMVPTMKAEQVNFRIGLYFTDQPPERTPAMLRLGKQDIDIRPGDSAYVIRDEFTLPVDVDLLSLQPHAHYLAKDVRGFARLPDGTRKPLLHIKDWEFHVQDVYRLVTPMFLPRGTSVQMEYTYDNSSRNRHNPSSPPGRVRWGQFTSDEMGDLWLQFLPRVPSDLPVLIERIRAKELAEDVVGYRGLLERNPGDGLLHANMAEALIRMGRRKEALDHFRAHARIEPDSAIAHYNAATALAASGRPDEALAGFRRAIALAPDDPFAFNGLGGVLLNAKRDYPAALAAFQEAVRLDPSYANGYNNMGVTLARMGRVVEALAAYLTAVEHDALNVDARFNAAGLLESNFRYAEAARFYRDAVGLGVDDYRARLRLAWVLGTAPQPPTRDPGEALRLARQVASERSDDPEIFDTLAAAEAAMGQYGQAVTSARKAVEMLVARGEREWADAVEARLALYRRQKPYVAPER